MLATIATAFIRPRTALWAWGALAAAIAAGWFVWSSWTIDRLNREAESARLEAEVSQLRDANDALLADRESIERRMGEMTAAVEGLNRDYSASRRQQGEDVARMTGEPGTDTAELERRANEMNTMFREMSDASAR